MKEIGMKEIRKKLKPCKPQYLPFVLYAIFKLLRELVTGADFEVIQTTMLRGRTWCYYLRTNYRGNYYSIDTSLGGLTNISVSVYRQKNIVDVSVKIVKAEFTQMNRNITLRLKSGQP